MNRSGDPSSSTNTELMRRVRAGDSQAWDDLVTIYGPLIYGFAREAGVPPSEIDDIVQQVLLGFAKRAASFDAQSFRGWLRRCTQRRAADYHRQRRRRIAGAAVGGSDFAQRLANLPANDDPAGWPANNVVARFIEDLCRLENDGTARRNQPDFDNQEPSLDWQSADDGEAADSTRRSKQLVAIVFPVFRAMKARCRLAFIRVALQGQDTADVARELDMPIGALHQCLSRTRDRLRKALFKADTSSAASPDTDPDNLGD